MTQTLGPESLIDLIQEVRSPIYILKNQVTGELQVTSATRYQLIYQKTPEEYICVGMLPGIYPEWLGDQSFLQTHCARFPYIVGEMANGIATAKMVVSAVRAGLLGFFGAAGLMPEEIEKNLQQIQESLNHNPNAWGSNLIHSPHELHLEEAAVDLYLKYNVQRVSASAYMSLTVPIVRYACTGLTCDAEGNIHRRNHVLAKISRPEVAKQFMSPAPQAMLDQLQRDGKITAEEARLAAHIPVAEDITVEADSGGHTDNRPLVALFPIVHHLAATLTEQYQYAQLIRVGAAGGLGTPSAVAAAFGMGAAYVLTGSVNQACVEAGISEEARALLTQADFADVMMAPAADMFELGVKLQVLKRGTMFAARANKLYEYYSRYASLEEIPLSEKEKLEKQILGKSLEEIWKLTHDFFEKRDPSQLEKATKNSKYKMALVFRWYLGLSSRWAIQGTSERKMDYQLWCGPAMGAFNDWVSQTFLADLIERSVAQIGLNLLEGAAIVTRAQQLRSCGFQVPESAFLYKPQRLSC